MLERMTGDMQMLRALFAREKKIKIWGVFLHYDNKIKTAGNI